MQSLKYNNSSSTPSPDIPYIEEEVQLEERSYYPYRNRWRGKFYSDLSAIIPEDAIVEDDSPTSPVKAFYEGEYSENTSSDGSDGDCAYNPSAVLKICKAIVVKNRNAEEGSTRYSPPVSMQDVNTDTRDELRVGEQSTSVNI